MRITHDTYNYTLNILRVLFGTFSCHSRNTGASPFSFTISVLGSFTCITQHTGPTALRPIRRTKQLWLSVLLKDTSVTTGIRTHILLLTPELESGKLDRSATTRSFHLMKDVKYSREIILLIFTTEGKISILHQTVLC